MSKLLIPRRSAIKAILAAAAAPAIIIQKELQAQAPFPFGFLKSPVAGTAPASCATNILDASDTSNGSFNVGNNVSRTYGAGQFSAPSTSTVCRVDLSLFKVLSPTMDVYISLWSNNATPMPDEPNAIIGSEFATPLNASTFSAADPMPAGTWASWTGLSFSITSGTLYFIVLRTSAQDAANYFTWASSGATSSGVGATDQDSVAPWSNEISRTAGIRLYTA